MLGQCSLRLRSPVCSSGGNSNRKSSFWRLVGLILRTLSPNFALTPKLQHYLDNDLTLKEAALKLGFVSEAEFNRVVDPAKMVHPYVAKAN